MSAKVLKNTYPHEMMFGVKPDYHALKTFGCLCFPCLRPYNKQKLSLRSTSSTFLGYTCNQKGYKCLNGCGRLWSAPRCSYSSTASANEGILPDNNEFTQRNIETQNTSSDSDQSTSLNHSEEDKDQNKNTHNMVIRAKRGIFKPKIYVTNLNDREPLNFDEATTN